MILKIGGCNGSGKTSMVRALLSRYSFRAETWPNQSKIKQYAVELGPKQAFDRIVVLGDYRNVCGGMDTISDKHQRLAMVETYCTYNEANRRTLVIFEGLITGKTYGAMGALSDNTRIPWVYCFMDTPFEECVRRVLARREAKGNTAPFDPERTMRPTYKSCKSVAVKAAEMGHPVYQLNHSLKPDDLATMLWKIATSNLRDTRKKA